MLTHHAALQRQASSAATSTTASPMTQALRGATGFDVQMAMLAPRAASREDGVGTQHQARIDHVRGKRDRHRAQWIKRHGGSWNAELEAEYYGKYPKTAPELAADRVAKAQADGSFNATTHKADVKALYGAGEITYALAKPADDEDERMIVDIFIDTDCEDCGDYD